MTDQQAQTEHPSPGKTRAVTSAILTDWCAEMVYDLQEESTRFVVFQDEDVRYARDITLENGERVVPFSPHNNLIRHGVVLLPSGPEDYDSDEALLAEIQAYIHRYVDVSDRFQRIAAYYVLFTWIYDAFNELPYLRLRGDYGSGKTRFLLTVDSLCYMPIFASGASTVSPLFHTLDAFRGTLIIDEADFRFSDAKAQIVKILNNGNMRGMPVLRTEVTRQHEFNPRAFAVFGPKLVATRGFYDDRALESRFITEEMGQRRLRREIPLNLPANYREEALSLRNKLLLYRLRTDRRQRQALEPVDLNIEPRLNQMFAPLMCIVDNAACRRELRDLARAYHDDLIAERGMSIDAQLLQVIRHLSAHANRPAIPLKDIVTTFARHYGREYDRQITSKWIGGILRRTLHLKTHKSDGVYVLPLTERPRLEVLFERYGITDDEIVDGDGVSADELRLVFESPDQAGNRDVRGFGDVG